MSAKSRDLVYRLTPAGRLEPVAAGELRIGDVFTRTVAERQREWLLVERHSRGGLRTRPADEMMAHVSLCDDVRAVFPVTGDEDEPEVDLPDHATPLAALLRREAAEGEGMDWVEMFGSFLRYCFAESPHPAHVMRRVFTLAFELEPKLLGDLDAGMLGIVRGTYGLAHDKRIELTIAGTRVQRRSATEHGAVISAMLQQAAARRHVKLQYGFPVRGIELRELLDIAEWEPLTDYARRMDALKELVSFAYYEGPRPGVVVRRVFSMAKWRQADSAVLLDMTLQQLGQMFGETRAAWSWRVKQVINRFLEFKHVHGRQASFQKSVTACETYAEAARGNQNRRGGGATRVA